MVNIGQIIDKYWTPIHPIEIIAKELSELIDTRIPKSTFAKMVQIEVALVKAGLSQMEYFPNGKKPNNPYRKRKQKQHRKTRQTRQTKKQEQTKITGQTMGYFYCNHCGGVHQTKINKTNNGFYGLFSHICKKCGNIGKGHFKFKMNNGNTKMIVLEEDKLIPGIFNEVIK